MRLDAAPLYLELVCPRAWWGHASVALFEDEGARVGHTLPQEHVKDEQGAAVWNGLLLSWGAGGGVRLLMYCRTLKGATSRG
jgi:hypothetical protein